MQGSGCSILTAFLLALMWCTITFSAKFSLHPWSIITVRNERDFSGTHTGLCTSNETPGEGIMKRFSVAIGLCILGLAFAGTLSAHHSVQAVFDIHKTITVSGTVAKVEWINPHSYLTVNVKGADGQIQKWAFELGGQAALRRAGMSRADRGGLKPGDAVTVSALPARDGTTNGALRELKLSDGRDFRFGGEDPNDN
jgi:uncharacterized protein DUF6152